MTYNKEEVEKSIEKVVANMRLSGFELTDSDKDLLRRIASGEASFDLEVKRIIFKARNAGQKYQSNK